MNKTTKLLATLVLGSATTGAMAAGLDGTVPLICAATTSVVCAPSGKCVVGAPTAVNLPTFWHIDPVAKVARSKRQGSEERNSSITTVAAESGKLILQGSDEGFGWSVSIDATSGSMVLTGGSDVGYLVFGECTTL